MSFAFSNLHDFIYMGHHGVYVWSAWFITLVALTLLVVQSKVVRQRFFREELAKVRLQKARAERLNQDSQ
ncbi:MAG TPA: heme exporter protein CcmD [Aquirhabdus sp.]